MRKLLTFLTFLLASIGAWADSHWTVSSDFDNPGSYTALNATFVTKEANANIGDYEVGAFIDGECRAVAGVSSFLLQSRVNMVLMRIPGNMTPGSTEDDGKTITFRVYNSSTGYEYDLTSSKTVVFGDENSANPVLTLKVATNIDLDDIEMNVNESVDLMSKVKPVPADASLPLNATPTWRVNDNYVSLVGNTVTANNPTTANGTTYSVSYGGYAARGMMYIFSPATSIVINPPTKITFRIGEDENALNELLMVSPNNTHYTVTPSNSTDQVRWGVSNTSIIAYSEDTGLYSLKSKGTTTVTPIVVHRDGSLLRPSNPSAIEVTVVQPVTSIRYTWSSNNNFKANVGDDIYNRLASLVEVLPATANDRSYTFSVILPTGGPASSNEVTIANNSLKFLQAGSYLVVATSTDKPSLTASLNVTIENPAKGVTFTQNPLNIMNDGLSQNFATIVQRAIVSNVSLTPADKDRANGTITVSGSALTLGDRGISDNGVFLDVYSAVDGTATLTFTVTWNDYSNYNGNDNSITQKSASSTLTVNIGSALRGFNVTHTPGANGAGTLVFNPIPANAQYTANDVTISLNNGAGYPQSWTALTSRRTDNNGVITITYTTYMPGFVNVNAGNTPLYDASIEEAQTSFYGFDVPATFNLSSGWQWCGNRWTTLTEKTLYPFFDEIQSNLVEVRTQNGLLFNDALWGMYGDMTSISWNEGYKIKMSGAATVSMDMVTFGGGNTVSIALNKGWTWIGSPYVCNRILSNVLSNQSLPTGTRIVSKNGFAEWTKSSVAGSTAGGGSWAGSLEVIDKYQGYLVYCPEAGKTLNFSAERYMIDSDEGVAHVIGGARAAGRKAWSYDHTQFANNMSMIAEMKGVDNLSDYTIGAFVNGECRGEGVAVDGKFFITVHGNSGEKVNFRLHNELTGEFFDVPETVTSQQMLGTMTAPVALTAPAVITGINTAVNNQQSTTESYDLLGRKVTNGKLLIKRMADGSVRKVVK